MLAGCASNFRTDPPVTDGSKTIYVVENRSVDLSVRKNFESALKLLKEEKYDEAIPLLKKVASNTENNSAPYINLGIVYSRIGKPDLAEENFNKALAINPNHPVTLNETALFYRGTGRFKEARTLYERIVAKHPDFMPARKNYGILCDLYLNDVGCALRQYEIYSAAHPEDEGVKLWIATLRQKQAQ